MSLSKNFYDLDPYEDYDIVQEGTEIGSMDFNFDDDEPTVVQEADEVPSTEKESIEVVEELPAEKVSQSTDTLPEDFWYTKGNSAKDIGKPITDEDIVNAEKELGYKLPESYKSVIKQQNGGRVNRCVFPYNRSCIEIDTLFGIDHDKPSLFETSFYVSEWGYPDIGLTVASTPSAGHDMVFLDYSECGKDGEPSVVVIDQELDYRKTKLAGNFGEFINKLVTRDEYDQKGSSNDTSAKDEPTLESYVQEDGESTPSDDDTVNEAIAKEEDSKEEEPRADETAEEDVEVSTEEEPVKEETEEVEDIETSEPSEDSLDESTTPEGDDLKDFGTDTSDVQNEYDPKEIEILNKLIAAEAEAINDYFDAAKDSHDSNARRLYSDIGHEERFHMEQLLFQKSKFTGEKYEPRDPEVKKEYEELLQMGMDDETAMSTAIDKQSMNGTDDGDDSDMVEFAFAMESVLTMLEQNDLLMEAAQYAYDKRGNKTIFDSYSIITEAYLYQEDVINTASQPKQVNKTANPFSLLIKGLKVAVNGLLSACNTAKNAIDANSVKRKRKLDWIKKNGITGLFKSGVSFNFYDSTTNSFDMTKPIQYVDMLYRLSIAIAKQCNIEPKKEAYHGTIKNPIRFASIADGINQIKLLNVTPTKIIVNDQNKDALTNELFGYNEQKINVKVWNAEANKAIYQSNNVYTKLSLFGAVTNQYLNITLGILEVLEKMQGDMNSIYYKNRNLYNSAKDNMTIIVTTYRKLINACAADLNTMMKFDTKILEMTQSRDNAEQTGQKWEGEDRRTSGSMVQSTTNENKFAKAKNPRR